MTGLRRMLRRVLRASAALAVALTSLLPAVPAAAHPLGDFSVNQYAGLLVSPDEIRVDYVLDMAELPAVTEQDRVRADADYPVHTCAEAAERSVLRVGGRQVALRGEPAELSFPPGSGGLATLRLECSLYGPASITGPTEIDFRNDNQAGRLGWHEITAVGDGTTITASTVAAASVSARLTRYPAGDSAGAARDARLDVRAVRLTVRPGGPSAASERAPVLAGGGNGMVSALTDRFTALVGRPQLTLGIGLIGVLLALVLGAGHAVAPGHGKTIMAAYLIGRRGQRRQALLIAGTVTATHTAGVLVLGVIVATSFTFAPQSLYGWLALANGLLVTMVGAVLLRRAVRGGPDAHHGHDHEHGHEHGGDHSHGHDHPHEHSGALVLSAVGAPGAGSGSAPAPRRHSHEHPHDPHHDHPHPHDPPSRRTVLAMGFAGGLTPSPSAVVVLLGAAALGRAWYGVLLVLAYGAGMAAALTGAGLLMARLGDRMAHLLRGRRGGGLLRRLPVAAAALVMLAGLGVALLAAGDLLGAA